MKKCAVIWSLAVLFTLAVFGTALAELPASERIYWKENSTATAAWDVIEGADYYRVHVFVYENGVEVGDSITGTADTEIDL